VILRPVSNSWRLDFGLLCFRVALGGVMFAHGAQKMFGLWGGDGWSATMEAFKGMGFSPILSTLAILAEVLGGAGLVLGALTPLAALGPLCVMYVAIVKVHLRNGFFINWHMKGDVGHGIEYNVVLGLLALGLLVAGPGRLSIDAWLTRRGRRKGGVAARYAAGRSEA